MTRTPNRSIIRTMLTFPPKAVYEPECFLSREVNLTIDGEEYNVQYIVIIRMDKVDDVAPKITDIDVEGIPNLDDYTFAPNLSDEEQERRDNKRDAIYEEARKVLLNFYKVEVTP